MSTAVRSKLQVSRAKCSSAACDLHRRAARNPQVQLEIMELLTKYGLSIEFIDGACDPSTAIGEYFLSLQAAQSRYMVRNLSESTQRSVKRLVDQGLFVGRAPFGYRNVRVNRRACAVVDEENAEKVRRIFELYAFADHTLDSLVVALWDEGLRYTTKQPQFKRKHLHDILGDRAYIGDLTYKGERFPGAHETVIERTTFRRVQVRLGGRTDMKHSLTFSHGLLRCGHCERQITGESKLKALASGEIREYVYYRCARYKSPGHPSGLRVRDQDPRRAALGSIRSPARGRPRGPGVVRGGPTSANALLAGACDSETRQAPGAVDARPPHARRTSQWPTRR